MTTRELQNSELSGAFVVRDPAWRKKIFFGGLLLLLLHPVGWPAALGYRKELISNLSSGTQPLLPEWRGHLVYFFIEGLKAMGVIFGYLSPLYLALLFLLLANGVRPNDYWLYAGLFFTTCTIFSTLSFPSVLIYWTFFSEGYRVPFGICLVLLAAFALIIFFIPSAFLQVSKSGRYLSAFKISAAYSTLATHFRAYVLAWYHSTLMSLSAHFALPFAPWGVVWCYLAIIYEFNSLLQNDPDVDSSQSWFRKLRASDQLLLQRTGYTAVSRCLNPADAAPCLLIKIGPVVIPLPKIIVKHVFRETD
ncbi:MAG: DUF4013 domain-containing protein [Fuerstiella sp.]|nr:DUF4013 domain-containing protein [Fuerstiella sp.]